MIAVDPNAAASADAGLFGLPHSPEDAGVVIVPAPWDVTTSYRPGAARGPAAVLRASHQIDLYDVETGRPYLAGIAMLDVPEEFLRRNQEARQLALPIIEAGGATSETQTLAVQVDQHTADLHRWIRSEAERWTDQGKFVGVLGGDHSVPESFIALMAERHPGLGILHIDAHADLRQAYEGFRCSHASIMFNVLENNPGVERLVQVGIRDVSEGEVDYIEGSNGRVITHFDAELAAARMEGETWAKQCDRIVEPLPDQVYLSVDIDGLDPSLCPRTGTPVPGGLSFHQFTYLLRALRQSGRQVIGFDLVEVAPGEDEWDANVGARILYKMIGWSTIQSASPPRR